MEHINVDTGHNLCRLQIASLCVLPRSLEAKHGGKPSAQISINMNPSYSASSIRVGLFAALLLCTGYLYSKPGYRETPSAQGPSATPPAGLGKEEIARQTLINRRLLESTYSRVLSASGFSGPERVRILNLMTERLVSGLEAHKIVTSAGRSKSTELNNTIDRIETDIDSEILGEFGEKKFATIKLLIDGYSDVRLILEVFDPALVQAGVPLADTQLIPLLTAMAKNYGTFPKRRFSYQSMELDASSGLHMYDKRLLEEARSFLTATQISVLSNTIGARNRTIQSKLVR